MINLYYIWVAKMKKRGRVKITGGIENTLFIKKMG